MRVNARNPNAAFMPRGPDKNPARYVRGGAKLLPRPNGQATAPANNVWQRGSYRVGDGETFQQMRPGASDHLKCKSFGQRT
jgi:hypothetical protein